MKKVFKKVTRLLIASSLILAVACNGTRTDDTDRTKSENESSHPTTGDTSMTDPTRNVTSGTGNDVSGAMDAQGFISKNILDNMTEIQMSKLGQQKGSDKKVTQIAGQMVTDHTQMLNDLKTLASKKQVSVPAANNEAASHMQSMQNATGKDFDKMWVSHMLTMHETKLAELQNVMNQTSDADVKALATKALPKIKAHRDALTQLNNQQQ